MTKISQSVPAPGGEGSAAVSDANGGGVRAEAPICTDCVERGNCAIESDTITQCLYFAEGPVRCRCGNPSGAVKTCHEACCCDCGKPTEPRGGFCSLAGAR